MRKRIRNLNIRQKLVFYSYLIITPILLMISTRLFAKNYRQSEKEEQEFYKKSVDNLSEGIEALLGNVQEFGTYICVNNDIEALLMAENVDELNEDSQIWIHRAPMRTLQDMIALSGQIKTLAIYPENGLKPYLRCTDATSYISDIKTVRETSVYQATVEKRGRSRIAFVGKDGGETYQANRTGKIVLYREIYDRAKKTKLGYLVVGASAEKYIQLCENSLPMDTAGIVVVNEEGEELLCVGAVTAEDRYGMEQMAMGEELPVGYQTSSASGVEYRIYSKKSNLGITVYELIPKDGIGNRLLDIATMPAALLFGFLLGLYPILLLVSHIVSEPLKRLCQAMEAFQEGDFDQKVEVTTGDEVGEASACFNKMVDSIRELIETNYIMALQEKECELNALQAQINPHFLYNTLDSLYWRAVNDGNDGIAEDILALSQLFRLVLGQGTGIISVGSERDLIERYLHIQKMRFSENLDYEIEMEEDILDHQIPKLILQPFVENAVVHGFEKAGDSCKICVKGRRIEDWLEFTIEDNGVGMSEEQVKKIWEVPDTKRYSGQRIGRYAIKNVRERLDLKYHSRFTLEIKSTEGVGTLVCICIPWDEMSS